MSTQEKFSGPVFPVVKVRYAGPTDTLGSRYIATTEGNRGERIRVTHYFDYALDVWENARRAAQGCWDKRQTSYMNNLNDYPTVLIAGAYDSNVYTFTAVPVDMLTVSA